MTVEMLPNSYLRRYGARYREAWRLAETLRSRRGKDGFPNWPDWCYVPAWYVECHIVAEGRASFPLERAYDPMILSALCAWRMGKGIWLTGSKRAKIYGSVLYAVLTPGISGSNE
jgi:hypothetical protein